MIKIVNTRICNVIALMHNINYPVKHIIIHKDNNKYSIDIFTTDGKCFIINEYVDVQIVLDDNNVIIRLFDETGEYDEVSG